MKVYIIEVQTAPGFWEKVGNTAYKDYKVAEQIVAKLRKESEGEFIFRIVYLEIK